jgi:hypothetical protein
MTDPQTDAVIDRLERARRRWKRLAVGALAALGMVLLSGAAVVSSQRQQIRAEQARAEQALRDAEAQRNQAQRALYASRIALAEHEWAAAQRQDNRP